MSTIDLRVNANQKTTFPSLFIDSSADLIVLPHTVRYTHCALHVVCYTRCALIINAVLWFQNINRRLGRSGQESNTHEHMSVPRSHRFILYCTPSSSLKPHTNPKLSLLYNLIHERYSAIDALCFIIGYLSIEANQPAVVVTETLP